jgi:hypothetical protein
MNDLGFEPHVPVDAESFFAEFVLKFGGELICDLLPPSPSFDNADYLFRENSVVAELKCLQTDFPQLQLYKDKFAELQKSWISESKISFGMIWGNEPPPEELKYQYVRLFRKRIQRILEKANKQIKETKLNLGFDSSQGLLIIINDGLYGLPSVTTVALISSILVHHFSSIDGFVYLTLNKYTDIPGDNYARLIWGPAYSDYASNSFVNFVNFLGRKWGDYLEENLGKFDSRLEIPDPELGHEILIGGKFVNLE